MCHFVLVHGACHGSWLWFKLKPLLEAARVTSLDLTASGVHPNKIHDVRTLEEYSKPLLDLLNSLPSDKGKVVLVGHSLGGFTLALAMDMYPTIVRRRLSDNIHVEHVEFPGVRVSAGFLLAHYSTHFGSSHSLSLLQYYENFQQSYWMDTEFRPYSESDSDMTTLLYGPKLSQSILYQNCSVEDLYLATSLVRRGSLFFHDLKKMEHFSTERYGSVSRIYIMCGEDIAIAIEIQHMVIDKCTVHELKEIKGSDHMPMLCKPQDLC